MVNAFMVAKKWKTSKSYRFDLVNVGRSDDKLAGSMPINDKNMGLFEKIKPWTHKVKVKSVRSKGSLQGELVVTGLAK